MGVFFIRANHINLVFPRPQPAWRTNCYRPGDFGFRAKGQDSLPVYLSPESHLSAKMLGNAFYVHTEELRVQSINPDIDKISYYRLDKSVGMIKCELPSTMNNFTVLAVEGFEEAPPELGGDEQGGLGAPIVHEGYPIYSRGSPHPHLFYKEAVQHIPQPLNLFGAIAQVNEQIFGAPQKLHLLEGAYLCAGVYEKVRLGTAAVNLREIRLVQELPRQLPAPGIGTYGFLEDPRDPGAHGPRSQTRECARLVLSMS